jgi:dienelactone hydrolase
MGDLLSPAAHAFERGWALAAIDFPLHGERSSPKLSERLVAGVSRLARHEELDADTGALVEEFARQATSDLLRTLEALAALEAIDERRLAYFGQGLGALIGSYMLASLDPGKDGSGLRGAALAVVGGGQGRADLDPATYLSRPRPADLPLLIVGAEGDERAPLASAKALYEAAAEPKEWSLVSDSRAPEEPLSQATWTTVHRFLAEALAG